MPGRSSLYSMTASMVSVCYLHEFCKLVFIWQLILLNLEKLEEVIKRYKVHMCYVPELEDHPENKLMR